jgi:hypothetical protein
MEKVKMILQNRWALAVIVAFGLAARMAMAARGHNYDMESYFIVADITGHDGNIYAETDRYNYGPIWFMVVHLLDVLSDHHHEVLRYLIAGLLSLADLGIFLCLVRLAGHLPAVLFFLNPVSIIITGYHSQIDNVAILLGLWSVILLGDDFETPINRRKFGGLLVLGLSLVFKHILFAFPVWLALKQKGFRRKIIVVAVPTACFLFCFVPFWSEGRQGILNNVIFYNSNPTNIFYQYFVPKLAQCCIGSESLWFCLLILFAFLCRTRSAFESLLIYTGVLVAFSPATLNEYLVIPMALAAVFWSVPFGLYTVITTFHLCADMNGPHFIKLGSYYNAAIVALCFALCWLMWKKQFLNLFQSIWREIKLQLGDSR